MGDPATWVKLSPSFTKHAMSRVGRVLFFDPALLAQFYELNVYADAA